MATSVGLNFRLTAAVDKFEAGMKDVEKRLNGIERSSRQTASGMKILATIEVGKLLVGGLTKVFSIMKTGVSSVTSLAKQAAAAADAIGKLSASTGVAVEPLQVFQKLAQDNGISGDKLGEALKRMTKRLAEAKMGFGEALPALQRLGLNVADLANMKPEQAFLKIGSAIGELPQKGAQAAAAFKIFSDQGLAMVPMFADMEKNVKATADELLDLGAVLSGTQIKNIETMNTRWQTVYETIQKIGTQVLGNLAPLITQMAEDALALVKAFEYNGNQGGQALANYLTDAMLDGAEMLAGVYDDAKDFFATFVIDLGHWLDDFGKWVARFTDMTLDGSSVDMKFENFHSDIAKSLQEQARSLNSQLSNMEMLNVVSGGLSEDAKLQASLASQRNKLMQEARDAESSYMSERKKSLVGETSMVETIANLRAKREQTENEQRAALERLTQKTTASSSALGRLEQAAPGFVSKAVAFGGKLFDAGKSVASWGNQVLDQSAAGRELATEHRGLVRAGVVTQDALDALAFAASGTGSSAEDAKLKLHELADSAKQLQAVQDRLKNKFMSPFEQFAENRQQILESMGFNPFYVEEQKRIWLEKQREAVDKQIGFAKDAFKKFKERMGESIELGLEDVSLDLEETLPELQEQTGILNGIKQIFDKAAPLLSFNFN